MRDIIICILCISVCLIYNEQTKQIDFLKYSENLNWKYVRELQNEMQAVKLELKI